MRSDKDTIALARRMAKIGEDFEKNLPLRTALYWACATYADTIFDETQSANAKHQAKTGAVRVMALINSIDRAVQRPHPLENVAGLDRPN